MIGSKKMKKVKDNISIQLVDVTKRYHIHHGKPTLVEKMIEPKDDIFIALDKINLQINKGEIVGIIGPNGSGKTTLLKIISRITSPSQGKVVTIGRIVSLIDLEAGFHPDLTGEQNIYLSGMLLGMKRKEITGKLKFIINFAGLSQFIDSPLFIYSEGMKLRLGFSIAISSNPDILLMDENFIVADQEFRDKSFKKIQKFFGQRKTVIIASHYLEFLKQNCNRMIYVDNGSILKDGDPDLVIKEYTESLKKRSK
jgi:ABC-type polysaccharide/polyol phosphate transport system ATPase subunit